MNSTSKTNTVVDKSSNVVESKFIITTVYKPQHYIVLH